MYLTRQLLSVYADVNCVFSSDLTSCGGSCSAMAMRSGIVSSRTESWSSAASFLYSGTISLSRVCLSLAKHLANGCGGCSVVCASIQVDRLTPRALAAALLTIGVSSWHRSANIFLISLCAATDALGYAVAYKAEADVRDVNQSP